MLTYAGYVLRLDILFIALETNPMTQPLQTLTVFQFPGNLELHSLACTVHAQYIWTYSLIGYQVSPLPDS